ncbi:MAG: hypothetical protein EXQ56_14465, partial [Acidobacteria bacterium]|nr:hypothetical protein [Acidobacteriota bacterium]
MDSSVIQLQQDALDHTVAVSDLLRKTLVISRKLALLELRAWAEQELSGYGKISDPPLYRMVRGEVRAWNPYGGWIPVIFQNSEHAEMTSERFCGQSVPELEQLAKGEARELHMPY